MSSSTLASDTTGTNSVSSTNAMNTVSTFPSTSTATGSSSSVGYFHEPRVLSVYDRKYVAILSIYTMNILYSYIYLYILLNLFH